MQLDDEMRARLDQARAARADAGAAVPRPAGPRPLAAGEMIGERSLHDSSGSTEVVPGADTAPAVEMDVDMQNATEHQQKKRRVDELSAGSEICQELL